MTSIDPKSSTSSEKVRTVLIADDDKVLNQAISDALTTRNIRVISIYNGLDALPIIKEHMPDLVILDILMPGKNGYEVCREIKEHPDLSEIPIIMFTVKDQQEDRLTGLKAGAIDYIAKPFFIDSLIHKIEYMFSKLQ